MQRLAIGLALVAIAIAITSDAWTDMFHIAQRDGESNYAFLVPAIAAWLAWVRIGRLRHCRVTGTWAGPVIIVAGWLMYSLGDRFMWQSVWHSGAIVILIGCIVSVTGKQLLLDLLPAFVALFFMVPVPGRARQQIALPLQTITAQITQQTFEMFGVMVERSGNLLSINGVNVAVVEACNGLRMIFALTLVSYAFAFSSPLRGYVRALVLIASPLSAVFCNVARLVPTVWIYGHYSTGVGDRFHSISGWVTLFVAFFILVGLIRFLRWSMVPVSHFVLAYD